MIAMTQEVQEKGVTPRKYRKHLKEINLAAAKELGEHFHQVNMPRRFTKSGAIMLNYAARKGNYLKRKRKEKGHEDPIVFSGFTKRMVLSVRDVRASGTSKKWVSRVVLRARHVNRFKNPKINLADEMTRVGPREYGPLQRVFEKAHTDQRDKIKE